MTVASCPECNTALADIHQTDIVKSMPEPGDLHLCGECATLSRYITPHLIERLTPEEILRIEPDELSEIRFAVRSIFARTNQQQSLAQAQALGMQGKRII